MALAISEECIILQTSLPTPAAPRTATAAAAMLLGAGLACAGVAHASSLDQPDRLDPSALPPGYRVLETDRARPTCDVLTVDGDFGEYDWVVYSVADPVPRGVLRHRMHVLAAYSTDDGATFPPFEDMTESLEFSPARRPATMHLTGRPGTTAFRLTCAYLFDPG